MSLETPNGLDFTQHFRNLHMKIFNLLSREHSPYTVGNPMLGWLLVHQPNMQTLK